MTHRPLLYLLPALFVAITSASDLHANDITISNPTLTGTNTVNATTQVQFDITWANSWRTSSAPNNWDAAWVFVKYRDANTGLWQHARLGDSHLAPVDAFVATGLLDTSLPFNAATNWGVGAFIYRATDGTGTFTANGTQLQWNYGQNGITYADIAEVKVFAVEMVYVPQGSFSVGDGTTTTVQGQFRNGSTNAPLLISSEAALTLGGTANGNLANNNAAGMDAADDFNNTTTQALPAAFPKGFAGFYLMKYSITQQQYVDFLNNLSRTQQNTRTGTNLAVEVTSVTNRYVMSNSSTLQQRNGIRCDGTIDANAPISFYCDLNGNGTGSEASDGLWVACNWLSWADVTAYLDWSGLRPMTELEYEKACRGPVTPVADEYAWGNANIRSGNYTGSNLGTITEGVSDPGTGTNGNALYTSARITPSGPGRVGLFAGAGTDRVNAGASYYGAMELSGNMWERSVKVGNTQGRAYTGVLGNGDLSATGNADVATWPGTGATGVGLRGGSWGDAATTLRVSDRGFPSNVPSSRITSGGGRGVRVFP
jgi:formylglycine-generating enzyme required for sulfatase activity